MEREQEEMQFLGFFGMVKESFKIIFTWRKIFSQITLALVLPLSFVFLAHIQVSNFLYYRIHHDERMLNHVPTNSSTHDRLSELITTEKIEYWLLMIAYFVFLLTLALLSTSAIVYTIACIYTGKAVTFQKVMTVVPKVWKRLMVTFAWSFLLVFCYNIIAFAVIYLMVTTFESGAVLLPCLIIFLILYLTGFVYISVIWHLASVISVLEEDYGIRAMTKSKMLLKGKMVPAVVIFLLLTLSYFIIQIVFKIFVVYGFTFAVEIRLVIGTICLLCLLKLFLFGLVIQTIIYFVCKSYHHENIDKSSLSDHLEVYLLAEYIPLKSKDVQLEEI
ncbi:hypothetical protein CRG98_000164 [Punica granatum]|uniref:Uncharacterized protein n=1 Tax=Punica granatum TaxID=22663 RepID=A0A2I0LFF3_PUNGR|nr:hypothetical protein CRG98_000164 [Punica granatum]